MRKQLLKPDPSSEQSQASKSQITSSDSHKQERKVNRWMIDLLRTYTSLGGTVGSVMLKSYVTLLQLEPDNEELKREAACSYAPIAIFHEEYATIFSPAPKPRKLTEILCFICSSNTHLNQEQLLSCMTLSDNTLHCHILQLLSLREQFKNSPIDWELLLKRIILWGEDHLSSIVEAEEYSKLRFRDHPSIMIPPSKNWAHVNVDTQWHLLKELHNSFPSTEAYVAAHSKQLYSSLCALIPMMNDGNVKLQLLRIVQDMDNYITSNMEGDHELKSFLSLQQMVWKPIQTLPKLSQPEFEVSPSSLGHLLKQIAQGSESSYSDSSIFAKHMKKFQMWYSDVDFDDEVVKGFWNKNATSYSALQDDRGKIVEYLDALDDSLWGSEAAAPLGNLIYFILTMLRGGEEEGDIVV